MSVSIGIDNVVKKYGDTTIIPDLSAFIKNGEFFTLLGPSGCGKTTLLRMIAGFNSIEGGTIKFDDKVINDIPAQKRNIGMVFQSYAIFPHLTVRQNVEYGLKIRKVPKEHMKDRVDEILKVVKIDEYQDRLPERLSGGQQQRVALARSIVMEPKVLLLDEPLSAIDAKLRKSLQSSIRQIHKELGLTTIFVTHDQDEAMVMSDVIQLFHAGKIEQSGSPIAMYTEPKTKFAAGFIGNYNILTASEFIRVTGKPYEASEDVAIRPETISVSRTVKDVANAYHFEGIIKNNTPRGNVLRYDIDVNGVMLKADVLFRSFQLYENGSRVQLAVENHNCLALK